LHIYKTIEMV